MSADHAVPLPPLQPMTKRTLIAVSHAIEEAAVSAVATPDEPVVLVAMFQRPMYFDRERRRYRELSRTTTLTVVGVTDPVPDVAPGIEGIALSPDEPLAAEWSVIMLTPRTGAALVAIDREDVVAGESTIEKGRLFDGWFSFHREHAEEQVARLVREMGDRLSRHARIVIDEVLDEAHSRRANPAEQRTDSAIRLVVDRLEKATTKSQRLEREVEGTGRRGGVDVLTGLRDRQWLSQYVGDGAGSGEDTLSVALVRLDIDGLDEVNRWAGKEVGDDLLRHVAMMMRHPLREIDHAVRLQDDDFLLLLPTLAGDQAARLAARLCADISNLRTYQSSTDQGVSATAAVMVTRERPLPLGTLEEALALAKRDGHPVVMVPEAARATPAVQPAQRPVPRGNGGPAPMRPYAQAAEG